MIAEVREHVATNKRFGKILTGYEVYIGDQRIVRTYGRTSIHEAEGIANAINEEISDLERRLRGCRRALLKWMLPNRKVI